MQCIMKRKITDLVSFDKKTNDFLEFEPSNKVVCVSDETETDDEVQELQEECDKLSVQLTEVCRHNRQYLAENSTMKQMLAESYENIMKLITDNKTLLQNEQKYQTEIEKLKQVLVDKTNQSEASKENQEKDRKIKLLEVQNKLLQSQLKEEKLHSKKCSEQLIIWKNKLVRNLARKPRDNSPKLDAPTTTKQGTTRLSLRSLAKPKN